MRRGRVPLSPRNAVLLILLAAAVWLRLAGIEWGLPGTYNSDEPHIVNTALAYASSFPRPYDFKYPALWPTVLFFCYGLYFLAWSCLGLSHRVIEFVGLYAWRPGGFYLIGRCLAALLSLFGALAVARFERARRGRVWPWAALALGFSPVIVEAAHSCKPDCMMFFLACLAWIAGHEVYREGSRKAHWLCGLFIGLSVSTQYTAAPLAILLPTAHLMGPKISRRRWLIEGIAAAALGFLVFSPYTFIDFPRFWADMKDLAEFASLPYVNAAEKQNRELHWLLMNPWNFAGPGSIAGLLMVAGLARLAVKEWRWAVILMLPVLLQCLALSFSNDGGWPRYMLGVFPGLALACAEALDWVATWRRSLLTLLLGVLALAPGLLRSALWDCSLRLPDTRPAAAEWIAQNLPAGSTILLDEPHASPVLTMAKEEVLELAAKTRAAGSPRARLYEGMAATHPGGGYRILRFKRGASDLHSGPRQVEASQADSPVFDARPGLDSARAMRIDYVVTSDYGAVLSRAPQLATFFYELDTQAELIKDFVPVANGSGGPVLRVFKLSRQR